MHVRAHKCSYMPACIYTRVGAHVHACTAAIRFIRPCRLAPAAHSARPSRVRGACPACGRHAGVVDESAAPCASAAWSLGTVLWPNDQPSTLPPARETNGPFLVGASVAAHGTARRACFALGAEQSVRVAGPPAGAAPPAVTPGLNGLPPRTNGAATAKAGPCALLRTVNGYMGSPVLFGGERHGSIGRWPSRLRAPPT